LPRRPGHSAGSLPGAVVEQGGAQHGVGRGELGRADPGGDLAVEFGDDGDDREGVVAAEVGEGDVQLPGVARVPAGRGVAPLLERVGDLPGRLPGHAQDLAEPPDRQRAQPQHPQRGRVTASVVGITEPFQAAGHLADPALPGQSEQVAEPIRGS
jgi:hypothetical protein